MVCRKCSTALSRIVSADSNEKPFPDNVESVNGSKPVTENVRVYVSSIRLTESLGSIISAQATSFFSNMRLHIWIICDRNFLQAAWQVV